MEEIIHMIVQALGVYAVPLLICSYVIKNQDDKNDKLLNFILDTMKQQNQILQGIQEQMEKTREFMAVIDDNMKSNYKSKEE